MTLKEYLTKHSESVFKIESTGIYFCGKTILERSHKIKDNTEGSYYGATLNVEPFFDDIVIFMDTDTEEIYPKIIDRKKIKSLTFRVETNSISTFNIKS